VFNATAQPATIDRLGVKITQQRVATTVWKAVHGKRVHWRVGLAAHLTNYAARLLGGWTAPIFARLIRR
jgi:hypothetical protein